MTMLRQRSIQQNIVQPIPQIVITPPGEKFRCLHLSIDSNHMSKEWVYNDVTMYNTQLR